MTLTLENFTDRARKVVALANQEAQNLQHNYVGVEHLLLGLVKEGSGIGSHVLKTSGLDLDTTRKELLKLVPKGAEDVVLMGMLPRTSGVKTTFDQSLKIAQDLGHNHIGTEHLLLGLLSVSDSITNGIFENLGIKTSNLTRNVFHLLDDNGDVYASCYLQQVKAFATKAHAGQTRSNGKPYITHPISVANRLHECGITDEKVIATALCHDILEDTKVTEEELQAIVGPEVLEAVKQLTNKVDVSGEILQSVRFEKKQTALLEHAGKYNDIAKRVKLADRYDNLADAIWDWEAYRVKRYANAGVQLLDTMSPIPDDVKSLEKEARRFFACLI